ncbi:MAG TPA: hypothetical protein VLV56_16045 [Burkholderiales bacterium]|nr:hypothetical protein [Burkholderiales bacterium]
MTMMIRLVVIGAAISMSAEASAQDRRVVTKTLVASEAQKECLSLNIKQRLAYKFRADGPVSFKLSHQDQREVIDLKRDATGSASGNFAPRMTGDHCLVWTNTGKHAVTLRYEFQRGPQ